MKNSTDNIRNLFLDYFASNLGHTRVSSSSLIPHSDPSLLFTNAGMVQFKDYFLGLEKPNFNTACSVQKCVRAGGKHNDLDNVGFTARHHTFFEMLGNFSFGDYFKEEAILYAWQFVTKELGIDVSRLSVTVHHDDEESYNIWRHKINIPASKISKHGEDNFWSMGDTGPCGPCTEIFYEHDSAHGLDRDDRVVEIWNLVFMQFNRQADGRLLKLPKYAVDTGMGLERITTLLQGNYNNYQNDIFHRLVSEIPIICGIKDNETHALRVIADHIRASCFLIADEVLPSNIGRGYVLRRIIRRALRFGYVLGAREPFFHRIVSLLVDLMSGYYSELAVAQKNIKSILLSEEEKFFDNLIKGMSIVEKMIKKQNCNSKVFSAEDVFKLYDTYGFPIDLTKQVVAELGFIIVDSDVANYIDQQKQNSRQANKSMFSNLPNFESIAATRFVGYEYNNTKTKIIKLLDENQVEVSELKPDSYGSLILEQTSFYAESGGQVADIGTIKTGKGIFTVEDCQKVGNVYLHIGFWQGSVSLLISDHVDVSIDTARRNEIRKHHSATHLLHAVLRDEFGDRVSQKGSFVTFDRLRFDFVKEDLISAEEINKIELRMNALIMENSQVETIQMSKEEAKASGALAFFGDKYGSSVRVLSMANGYSKELCGGTHVEYTGEIGSFSIKTEQSIAQGVRRIEATVGMANTRMLQHYKNLVCNVSGILNSSKDNVVDSLNKQVDKIGVLQKQNTDLISKNISYILTHGMENLVTISGIGIFVANLDFDKKYLMLAMDRLRENNIAMVSCLYSWIDAKLFVMIQVSGKDINLDFNARDILNVLKNKYNIVGGGKPNLVQAGGSKNLVKSDVMQLLVDFIKEKIN